MPNNHTVKAAGIIKKIIYITLATVTKDGLPWNSPLYSAYDKDMNFYWASDWKSIHSDNIRNNSMVSCVIYDSTAAEGTGEGVYFSGKAYELRDKGIAVDCPSRTKPVHFNGNNIIKIYKVVPNKIWMNDVVLDKNGKYVKDIRVELLIEELKKLI